MVSDYQEEFADDYLDDEVESLDEQSVVRQKPALQMIEAYLEQRELDKILKEDFGFD